MADDFDPSDYRDRSDDPDEFGQVGSDDSSSDSGSSSSSSSGSPQFDPRTGSRTTSSYQESISDDGGGSSSSSSSESSTSSSSSGGSSGRMPTPEERAETIGGSSGGSKTTEEATQESTRDQGVDDPDSAPSNAPDPDDDLPRGDQAGDGTDDAPGARGGVDRRPQASDRRTAGINRSQLDQFLQVQEAKGGTVTGAEIGGRDPTQGEQDVLEQLESDTVRDLGEGDVQIERIQRDGESFVTASLTEQARQQERSQRRQAASRVNRASDRQYAGINRSVLDAMTGGDGVTAAQEVQARQQAAGELEKRLEEDTGADLERGEDFTVTQEEGKFSAELTEQGKEKAERQIQQGELSSAVEKAEDIAGDIAVQISAGQLASQGRQDLAEEAREEDFTVDIPGEGAIATERGKERFDTDEPLPGEELAEDFESTVVEKSSEFGEKTFSEDVAGESLIAEGFRAAGKDKLADQSSKAVRSFGTGLVTAPGALVGKAATVPYDVAEFAATASQQSVDKTASDLASSATEAAVAGAAGFARDPATTSGAIVGSAALSGGVFRATQGTRAGTAARVGLQPGEEVVKAGIRRGVLGRRAARVTPGVNMGQVRGVEAKAETQTPAEAAKEADAMDLVKDLPEERSVTLDSETVDEFQGTSSPSRASLIKGKTKRTASRVSSRISKEIDRTKVKTRIGAGPGAIEIEREAESEAPAAPTDFNPQTRRRATEPELTDDRVSDNLLQQSIDQQLRKSRSVQERGTFEGEPRPFSQSETRRRRQEIESRIDEITSPSIETETESELSGKRAGLLGAIAGAGATSTELTTTSAEIGSMAGAAGETETGVGVDSEIENAIDTESELGVESETEFEQELGLETEREQEIERERERERERELERELEAVSPDLKSEDERDIQSFDSSEYQRTFSSDIKDPEEVLTDLTGGTN